MKIQVFDVDHGFCALVTGPNGGSILMDCGHSHATGFRPSTWLPRNGFPNLDFLTISNFDEDHISDLSVLLQSVGIRALNINTTVSIQALRAIKLETGPISVNMNALLWAMGKAPIYTPTVVSTHFYGMEVQRFCNPYPMFSTTNNLSLVTFFFYDGFGVVFPGDLEPMGWRMLLKVPQFVQALWRTTVFVASHHGRESGYCSDVFKHCRPEVAIISDKAITYSTQEKDCYGPHCGGVMDTLSRATRRVFTTRKDGGMTIQKTLGRNFVITTGT